MSNQPQYNEMIDAYLTGRLSPEDSARLMKSLEQDPALKEEFLLQKELVHSLQLHRKQELKARLNKIEVGPGYALPSSLSLKLITGAAVVALLGTGAYFAFGPEKAENEPENLVVLDTSASATREEISPEKNTPHHKEELPVEEKSPVEGQSEETEVKEEIKTESISSSQEGKIETKAKQAPEALNTLNTIEEKANPGADLEVVKPEVISFFDEADAASQSPEAEAPEDALSKIREFNTQNIEVSTRKDSRYAFHYSFFDNQLNIYGDFSKVPYEVLEVNTGSTTSYYLYHSGKYYELNPNQRKVTRLRELNNEEIIKELEITRKEKLNK